MLESLEGKTAIITGASSGIGRETAFKLAKEGANIVLASRSEEELEKIEEEIEKGYGVEALPVKTDVTEVDDVAFLFEITIEEMGSIDIVVNNAGLARGGEVEVMTDDEYHNMMDVNCDGMFYVARAALPYLTESEGNLVFLGSFAGQYPRPANPVYAATKYWTRGFAKSLMAQVGEEGVSVTVVNPTEVRTKFASESGSSFKERFEEGEVTEPEDIAEAISYAVKQEDPNTVEEVNLFRKNKFDRF